MTKTKGKKTRKCKTCESVFVSYNPNPQFCSMRCRADDMRHEVPLDTVIELYENGMTQEEVAKELGTTQKVIWKRMKEGGYKARVAYKRDQYGENNAYWNGGRTVDRFGYIRIKTPGHPRASVCGEYVAEHVLVVEEYIGRHLEDGEIIHHINGATSDNKISNLFITNPVEHTTMHSNGWAHTVVTNLDEFKGEI